jgi:hypothetical protein
MSGIDLGLGLRVGSCLGLIGNRPDKAPISPDKAPIRAYRGLSEGLSEGLSSIRA